MTTLTPPPVPPSPPAPPQPPAQPPATTRSASRVVAILTIALGGALILGALGTAALGALGSATSGSLGSVTEPLYGEVIAGTRIRLHDPGVGDAGLSPCECGATDCRAGRPLGRPAHRRSRAPARAVSFSQDTRLRTLARGR